MNRPISQDPVKRHAFVIPSGDTTSDSNQLFGHAVVGLVTPNVITSTTAHFDLWDEYDDAWRPLYASDGTEVSITIGANRHIAINPILVPYAAKTRIRVDSPETAERTIHVVTRQLG